MIAITGATGQLGRLVIKALLRTEPPGRVAALVRSPAKAAELAALGVEVREADYDRPDTLGPALAGVERLLLISSSEVGQRVRHHAAVIDAARAAGVQLLAYTSMLRADTSPLLLAEDHKRTEELLHASGLPFVLLRNGWYTENHLAALGPILAQGALMGAAGEGRIASAARADYADAAAAVLLAEGQAGRVYELAGDEGWHLAELAAEIARQTGKPVGFHNMPQADYEAALKGAGLPDGLARLLADADARAAEGALFGDGGDLIRLIGRPSTPLSASVGTALGA